VVVSLAAWFLAYLGAWWVMSEGGRGGWAVATAAAAAAVLVRHRLGPVSPGSLRPGGLLRFVPYFLWQSLRGGADVALRAFRRPVAIAPALLEYQLRLPEGPARSLFVASLSLLPGTFSADVEGDVVRVHVLDGRGPELDRVAELEERVGAVFGVGAPGGGSPGRGAHRGGGDGREGRGG
jgi:multicomponent Na+:H+ antiporter subunit E